MKFSEEQLRSALGNALNSITKDICSLHVTDPTKIQVHKLFLKLVNTVLKELNIDKQKTIDRLRNNIK